MKNCKKTATPSLKDTPPKQVLYAYCPARDTERIVIIPPAFSYVERRSGGVNRAEHKEQ